MSPQEVLLYALHMFQNPWCVASTLFALAIVVRSSLNNITTYSPADETSYTNAATWVIQQPFRKVFSNIARSYIQSDPNCYIHPLRFSWYTLLAGISLATGGVSYRRFAWISTITGAFAVPIAYAMGGLPAALLVLVSPINLAMGRRALQDGTLSTLTALTFLCATRAHWLPMMIALTALLFLKEVSVVGWPGYLTVYLLSHGAHAGWVFLFPIALFVASLFLILNINIQDFRTIHHHLTRHENDPYAMGYGRGPYQTYVVEFALLSPLVAILVVRSWVWNPLATGAFVYILTWGLLKFKNYRFFTGADIILRVICASAFNGSIFSWLLLGLCLVLDILMFRRVFIQRNVYDPVIHTVEQALDMVP